MQLKAIVMSSEKIIFHPEQSIIRKNEFGNKGFLIISGSAQLVDGPILSQQSEILGPGTFIGEMAMLMHAEYGSTIISRAELKALQISYDVLQKVMAQDLGIAEHFADYMHERFLQFTSQLQHIEKMFDDGIPEGEIDENFHKKGAQQEQDRFVPFSFQNIPSPSRTSRPH